MNNEIKFLLTAINAKYIHSNLAIYSLQAYAKVRGVNISIAEYTMNQLTQDILREIYMKKPDVLCFSCYIWNIEYVKEIANEFHKLCPEIPIWLGGPEVSFETEKFLKENPAITGIMIGEGEEVCYQLYCFYQASRQLSKLKEIGGIAYRDHCGKIILNHHAKLLNMDDLPFCYENLEKCENRIIYYESSRGCPFSCSYCLSSIDKHLRLRSLPLVYRDLQFFLEHKVPQVKFVDRTFNCNPHHAMRIWQYIYEHDNGITNFHFEISADLLTEEEIALLHRMRQGLVQLEIGVQSVNAETIMEIHRTMDLDKVKNAVRRIKSGNNIHQHLDLIAGLPLEGYLSFQKSFDAVYALKPQQLQLGFLKVLKGSYMYEQAKAYQLIYQDKPPYEVMATKWLSYDEMLQIKMVEEMLEIHYNSGQFLTALYVLEFAFDSAFEMYLRLAQFYNKKGLLKVSLSRIERYEIFYEFVLENDAIHIKLYEDALLYDLYIRENAKKRPTWAVDLQPFKKEIGRALKASGYEGKYCHAEGFTYAVYQLNPRSSELSDDIFVPQKQPQWIVFDYEHKNRWTNEAKTAKIDFKGV